MNYEVEQTDIKNKLHELSLDLPTELAFLPENLESVSSKDQFIFTDSMVDLRKLFKQRGIDAIPFGGDTELYRSRKNADIYLPAIFFSLSQISENPTVVSISLNVLSNYITDLLKGSFGRKMAQVEFYIETKEKEGLLNLVTKEPPKAWK